MIDGVTGNKRLPENVTHDIIERTDGIPLVVEEMTKAVLEAENEEDRSSRHTAYATNHVDLLHRCRRQLHDGKRNSR